MSVRLTDPALDDLDHLARTNAPVLRWALEKLLLVYRDPEAGEPLHKELAGWRKLVVGDRDWRVIWRVTFDDASNPIVDIAEVWAVGARSDSEVYGEMRLRVALLPQYPPTTALGDLVDRFEKVVDDLEVPVVHVTEPLPGWLRDKLRAIHIPDA
ncbi:MAG: type II toxin-antitoxin system RelE family toxin [Acidimicrobiales bacterium]